MKKVYFFYFIYFLISEFVLNLQKQKEQLQQKKLVHRVIYSRNLLG
uniref:Uncharacterized protein n=1 Tax=Meloidogyne enterolobii TaxID=390850 RepID=A0A6V7W323_MELEN|nr:unnamed protein product [Meloidogyne enterolobii]